MATTAHASAVKSLNKSPGGRRFVFQTLSQQINNIDIDVYRSLVPLKAEPKEGSTFFLDCLVEWRELNTAEDFITFYEEMMPLVQTLPQIILQKEFILSALLSRLHMKARLSLEPILRLIAELSRDLLDDFVPFLQRISKSFESLLKSGADKVPEIFAHIFTSWSYIMMYLQKYLVRDVVNVLKITGNLRYYPKDYVQEFMAESVSFLLRNTSLEQLIKGIRKVIFEVAKDPSETKKSGVCALLWYTMRGTSSGLHSKAAQILPILADTSLFAIGDKYAQGTDTVLEVLVMTFERLCEDIEAVDLRLMWDCLYNEITDSIKPDSIATCNVLHLTRILSLLVSTMQTSYSRKLSDYQQMLGLFEQLREKFLIPSRIVDQSVEFIDKLLKLSICILDGLYNSNNISELSSVSVDWVALFSLKHTSLLTFIKDLVLKDQCILHIFRTNIICALNDLVEISEEEVIHLVLKLCEKLQVQSSSFLEGIPSEKLVKIQNLFQEELKNSIKMINDSKLGDLSSIQLPENRFARIWGILKCYPYILNDYENPALLLDLVNALDELMNIQSGPFKSSIESLIAIALASYFKVISKTGSELQEFAVSKSLYFAKRYSSSPQILSSVADNLDFLYGSKIEDNTSSIKYHPELISSKLVEAMDIFSENLRHFNNELRFSTLRILCHYEPLKEQHDEKKIETDINDLDTNILQLLLSIEATPLSIATSRKVTVLISQIQMRASISKIPQQYIPIVLNGIIGIFHIRFNSIWDPALDCLAVLIGQYSGLLWEKYIQYLDQSVSKFMVSIDQSNKSDTDSSSSDSVKASDLVESFRSFVTPESDNTPFNTVMRSLIQVLQKVPSFAESKSRHVVPLFLKFLGYDADNLVNVESYNFRICKGKAWKSVLKEWLSLFTLMRNPKSFYLNQFFKEVLLSRLLDDNDEELQTKALDCLLNWKDESIRPYDQHLKKLINVKTLREELTVWSLSRDSNQIEENHRSYLAPVVIRLLVPKVRKLKTLAKQKNASVCHRKAVIGFLAQLDIDQLPLFFSLLMKPLHSQEIDGTIEHLKNESDSICVLKQFSATSIKALSWKKRYSFLHVVEEILAVFDDMRISSFLDLLMGCVVRILESCSLTLDARKINESSENEHVMEEDENQIVGGMSVKQSKDLRSFCLKVISFALTKYDNHDFGNEFWDIFFTSVKSLITCFKQEGASSVKPSSLFCCFLAMSRSEKLVGLLFRAQNLIPDIFSMLTVITATDAIVSSVFKFIENLLILGNELSDEDATVKKLLIPHLDVLVCSMHFTFTHSNVTKRKMLASPGVHDLGIFRLLLGYIKEISEGEKFIEILLLLITKKPSKKTKKPKRPQNSELVVETLQIIRKAVSELKSECSRKIMQCVSPLLIDSGSDIRSSICDVLDAVALNDPSMFEMAKLLHELNATSTEEMGGLDYDIVTNAYNRIDEKFFYTIGQEHAIIILSHAVHHMSCNDLVLRHCAFKLLCCFVKFSGKLLGHELENNHVLLTEAEIHHLVTNFLLKHMGDAMDKEGVTQKVWIDLLRKMVKKLPTVVNLKSYQALCSKDAEQDFFKNIVHLQKHRKSRALSRFSKIVKSGILSEVITNKVFVPLFFNMFFELHDGKEEHIRAACMEALGSISSCMNWKSYYSLLLRCFREMKLKLDKRKVLLRLICSILDHFHFYETHTNQEKVLDHDTDMLKVDELSNIRTCLQKKPLPVIQKMLSDSSCIDVNVSLVALKLLKLLPGDMLQLHLPSIIHRISNFLKDNHDSVREEARSALAACLKELGLEYLQAIVKVLRSTLQRGFQMHVLGFTLNFLLSKILVTPVIGQLDFCFEDLLAISVNDILGTVSEEKEVDKIASKMKETRKQKSYGTLKLIAQNVTFKTHCLDLLSHVTVHLQKELTPKVKSKLENMLKHIAAGIECNPSVDPTDLLVFTQSLLKKPDEFIKVDPRYSHHITVFSLGLLQNYLKNVKLPRKKKDDKMVVDKEEKSDLLPMLNSLVKPLTECLNSKYEDIISGALRCLSPLVRLPLPSFGSMAKDLKNSLLSIAQNSFSTNTPLMDSCIGLLTVLLRSNHATFTSDELQMLFQFPLFIDLDKSPSYIALSLLKTIIQRKLVAPEIYDIVQRVAEIMVKTQVETIRNKCTQIFLHFLLDYRISEKRLQHHLDFLLAHLNEGYKYSSGKEAVLEMLHAIIKKFPVKILDEQCQTVFLQLVSCLTNDPDSKVRVMIGTVMKLLISSVSDHKFLSMLEYSCFWYSSENHQLWSAGAQALGLLVEAKKLGFQSRINEILTAIRRTILKSVSSDNHIEGSKVPFWKEAYYSLILLEKILHEFPQLILQTDLEDIWERMCELLLHPHLWLRNVSNRLLGVYFNACEENKGTLYFLMTPSRLFLVAVSLCCQLKVEQIDVASGSLIRQNLEFCICNVHSLLSKIECENPDKFWSSIESDEQGRFLKALDLLDSRKGRALFASLTTNLNDDVKYSRYTVLAFLIKKMGIIALQMEPIQMEIVFNCFKSIASELLKQTISESERQNYVYQILLPLYKVRLECAGKIISDEVKLLANDVWESISKSIGSGIVDQVNLQIIQKMKAKREKRQNEVKRMAVVNPMRNAKRKLRIAAKNKANKKRRITTAMKVGRWIR